ncbi:MAG: nucleotidyltransferase family protein [Opitutaceae bacterium]
MKVLALRDRDVAVLRRTLGRCAFVREARVFGSRASGMARRASDLDLAVSAPDASGRDWAELCEALENAPLIYEIDLVRPEKIGNPRLRERIEREGVRVFPEESDGSGFPSRA